MKITTTVTTTLLMTILIHLVAVNAVFNSLYTVNAVNAVYKKE